MIDLRKPLEGIPGLLLLAALVLFGATIGVSLALLWSWIDMKDNLANFLGGTIGGGLGSALAVLGAVHVYRQERRERIAGTAASLLAKLHWYRARFEAIRTYNITDVALKNFLGPMLEKVAELPDGEGLSAELVTALSNFKTFSVLTFNIARANATSTQSKEERNGLLGGLERQVGAMIEMIERLAKG